MVQIAHLSDIHIPDWSDFRTRDWFSKRATGYANHRFLRRSHHEPAVVAAAVAHLVALRPDHVIVSGDLTNTGMPSELRAAEAVLAPLREAGIPTTVLPGNHDRYVPEPQPPAFERLLEAWLAEPAQPDAPWPRRARCGPVDILHLDSTLPTPPMMAWGRLEQAQLEACARALEATRAAGRHALVAVHHHPRNFRRRRAEWSRDLRGARALRALVTAHGAALVIHGHNHFLQVARMGGAQGPVLCGLSSTSIGASALREKRAAIGLYRFDEDGLAELAFSPYDTARGAFGPAEALPLADIPLESQDDEPRR